MKIMGIDHGTNYTGWAVVKNETVEDFGIRDYTTFEWPEVTWQIYHDFLEAIWRKEPDVVVVEKPVHFRNAISVRTLVGAYNSVVLAAYEIGAKVVEIKPTELKKIVSGKGNADKWDVAVAVQKKYGLDFDEIAIPLLYKRDDPKGKYKKGDIRDRLYDPADAIALCWAFSEKIKKGAA